MCPNFISLSTQYSVWYCVEWKKNRLSISFLNPYMCVVLCFYKIISESFLVDQCSEWSVICSGITFFWRNIRIGSSVVSREKKINLCLGSHSINGLNVSYIHLFFIFLILKFVLKIFWMLSCLSLKWLLNMCKV